MAKLSGALTVNGDMLDYQPGDLLLPKGLTLTEMDLLGIPQGSNIVTDHLVALEDLNPEDIIDCIASIKVGDHITATKANIKLLLPYLTNYHAVEKTLVPDGYDFYKKFTLSPQSLAQVKGRKLFVKQKLYIQCSPQEVLDHIDAIMAQEVVVDAEALAALKHLFVDVKKISQRSKNHLQNMSKLILTSDYLMSVSNVSIENMGKLVFADDISPDLIGENIAAITNMGKITCTKDQYTAIMQKVKENMGKIAFDDQVQVSPPVDSDLIKITNMGYVRL